jgi:hypothetical protein
LDPFPAIISIALWTAVLVGSAMVVRPRTPPLRPIPIR